MPQTNIGAIPANLFDCADLTERKQGISAAIDAVERGDLVVIPTDTVYGIGANAFDEVAVTQLLAAKRRGRDMPVPVLVPSRSTVDGLVLSLSGAARDLMAAFWPGALTLVVEQAPSLAWDLGDTDGTVAVRMPLHPVALEVLASTGPAAVSSANVSGNPPAATAAAAQEQFGSSVSVYLEAGPSPDLVPSSIIDVTGDVPELLRLGAIDLDRLTEVVPDLKVRQSK
ncbi:MAG TPA: L-threonylcarbamoyladenylate synthase [Mycobacteriales bacterium]|jgi:tRNA threonylcarbamoyl adenosine modification protein (Sua5/YciO/YrdC/YwlC family)|nr:L-threonylcarbamoyladenylate synthase [Mycobacteriales bacterium]